mmetsp:Transcript_27245/g.45958  ORF Transcript_27245/g.45958 Transcript_27245/m.45958 type:complete len:443 (+) Transcript_27245:58-1386(+)
MEFVDVLGAGDLKELHMEDESTIEEKLSLGRRRIILAQIRDSAVSASTGSSICQELESGVYDNTSLSREEEILDPQMILMNAETFESVVEKRVYSNESALMEMDELITQIQHRRTHKGIDDDIDGTVDANILRAIMNKNSETNANNDIDIESAVDKVVPGADAVDSESVPESEVFDPALADTSPGSGKKITEDDFMQRKLQSLQSIVQERRSHAGIDRATADTEAFRQLCATMKDRFGDDLQGSMLASQPRGDDEGGTGETNGNNNRSISNASSRASSATTSSASPTMNHLKTSQLAAATREAAGAGAGVDASVSPRGRTATATATATTTAISLSAALEAQSTILETQFRAIDLEIREQQQQLRLQGRQTFAADTGTGTSTGTVDAILPATTTNTTNTTRAGTAIDDEARIMNDAMDLQQGVSELEDSLRDFTSDLDRLLMS